MHTVFEKMRAVDDIESSLVRAVLKTLVIVPATFIPVTAGILWAYGHYLLGCAVFAAPLVFLHSLMRSVQAAR